MSLYPHFLCVIVQSNTFSVIKILSDANDIFCFCQSFLKKAVEERKSTSVFKSIMPVVRLKGAV
jgi:hypothetical protein